MRAAKRGVKSDVGAGPVFLVSRACLARRRPAEASLIFGYESGPGPAAHGAAESVCKYAIRSARAVGFATARVMRVPGTSVAGAARNLSRLSGVHAR